jgi:hypothetical protein
VNDQQTDAHVERARVEIRRWHLRRRPDHTVAIDVEAKRRNANRKDCGHGSLASG